MATSSGGRSATRGFFYQAALALMEALERHSERDWISFSVEPEDSDAGEKVDILWVINPAESEHIQVKHSINPLTMTVVGEWADDLARIPPARVGTKLRLVIFGTPNPDLRKSLESSNQQLKAVTVCFMPTSADQCIQLCAHHISHTANRLGRIISAGAAESVVHEYIGRIFHGSIKGCTWESANFTRTLAQQIDDQMDLRYHGEPIGSTPGMNITLKQKSTIKSSLHVDESYTYTYTNQLSRPQRLPNWVHFHISDIGRYSNLTICVGPPGHTPSQDHQATRSRVDGSMIAYAYTGDIELKQNESCNIVLAILRFNAATRFADESVAFCSTFHPTEHSYDLNVEYIFEIEEAGQPMGSPCVTGSPNGGISWQISVGQDMEKVSAICRRQK